MKQKQYTPREKLICDWIDKTNYLIQYRLWKIFVGIGTVVDRNIEKIIFFKKTLGLKNFEILIHTRKVKTKMKVEIIFENS